MARLGCPGTWLWLTAYGASKLKQGWTFPCTPAHRLERHPRSAGSLGRGGLGDLV